ncbi:MAG: dihydrolipoyl dehydrogenase [Desulfobacteraceae bacterium]
MKTRIAILGAGPGGYTAALRAARMGADVSLIEKDNVGGTCLNWGCIPSKIMITTAELLEKMRRAESFGITIEGGVRVNMPALMERKRKIINDQRKGIQGLLKKRGIRYIQGTGRIIEGGPLEVRTNGGGEEKVPWDKLILATGSSPLEPPGLEFDGQRILSSNHALGLEEVPESVLIVGGGVIGCEFASLLTALGSRVTIVEALSRLLPLPSVDEDCSRTLQREMKKRRISFMLNRSVMGVEEKDGRLIVEIGPSPFLENLSDKDRERAFEQVDKVLVCIGRTPNSTNIEGFDSLGVEHDNKGWVSADQKLQTSNPDVYAIGDLLGPSKIMLAHVASAEGLAAAENAAGGDRAMDYGAVPNAVFTTPEVAAVGLTEARAREEGRNVRSDSVLFRVLGKAHAIGDIAGQAKIVSEIGTGRILGVHIIGPHATDLIAEATLAVKAGVTLKGLAETIHAHPTLPEIMMETSLKALGRSLHG